MRTHLSRWLPTVLALLALVVALGGPAEAKRLINGKDIKKESITGKQVKDGSLTGTDLAAASITGAHVVDGSLTGADLKPDALGPDQLADNSIGLDELAPNAVQGKAVDAFGFFDTNFASVTHGTCATTPITVAAADVQDGTLADDAVYITPGPTFTGTFTYAVQTTSATALSLRVCNIGATDADPDGGGAAAGKTWRWVAIDLN